MSYFILRNGQQYGPYSPANLQLYLTIGNISLSDLGRTEMMNEWLPLSQIVGNTIPSSPSRSDGGPVPVHNGSNSQPQEPVLNGTSCVGSNVQPMPPPSVTPGCAGYPESSGLNWGDGAPLPPGGLHWGLLLLLVVVTLGLFGAVWAFVQANWVRKIDQQSKAIHFLVIAVVFSLLGAVLNGTRELLLWVLTLLVAVVLIFVAVFAMRASIEHYYNSVEMKELRLSGVMTFFFGILYFQYHLHRMLQEMRAGQAEPGAQPRHYARSA